MAGQMINEYIKGEERSFTIIAYPIPEIGDRFEEIFAETVKLNTCLLYTSGEAENLLSVYTENMR